MLHCIRRNDTEGILHGGGIMSIIYKTMVGAALLGILATQPISIHAQEDIKPTQTESHNITTSQVESQRQESKIEVINKEINKELSKELSKESPQTVKLEDVAKKIKITVEDSYTKKQVLENLQDYLAEKEEDAKNKEQLEEEAKKQLAVELKQIKEEWTESLSSFSNEDTQLLMNAGITIKGHTEVIKNHATILEQVGYLQEDANIYFYVLNGPALMDDGLFDLLEEVLTKEANLVVIGTEEQSKGLSDIFGDSKWYTFSAIKEDVTVKEFTGIMEQSVKAYKTFNDNPIITKHLPKNNRVYQGVKFATYPTVPNQSSFNYGFEDPSYTALLGNTHKGVDISYTTSVRDIYSVDKGTVTKVNTGCAEGLRDCGGGYGNYVEVSHPHLTGTIKTIYAHLESVDVKQGQEIKAGQYLGEMGNTGRSDGNHLHFEVFSNNQKVNPIYYINFDLYK